MKPTTIFETAKLPRKMLVTFRVLFFLPNIHKMRELFVMQTIERELYKTIANIKKQFSCLLSLLAVQIVKLVPLTIIDETFSFKSISIIFVFLFNFYFINYSYRFFFY